MSSRYSQVLSTLRRKFERDADVADVEAYLSQKGYNRRQIGEIISRFRSQNTPTLEPAHEIVQIDMTFRVLGPHERGRFAPEAWGHLLAMSGSGALSAPELEHVIERALSQFEGRIALDDVRALIESSGIDETPPGPDHPTVH
jgi:Smg protein